uniref:Uncharacterized protein n=1 Tax=Glossina austeni TaxID=7395 RepID=A0A1A9UD26_GLOAU
MNHYISLLITEVFHDADIRVEHTVEEATRLLTIQAAQTATSGRIATPSSMMRSLTPSIAQNEVSSLLKVNFEATGAAIKQQPALQRPNGAFVFNIQQQLAVECTIECIINDNLEQQKLERIYNNAQPDYLWHIRRRDFKSREELLELAEAYRQEIGTESSPRSNDTERQAKLIVAKVVIVGECAAIIDKEATTSFVSERFAQEICGRYRGIPRQAFRWQTRLIGV